jgi:hypothetical protein
VIGSDDGDRQRKIKQFFAEFWPNFYDFLVLSSLPSFLSLLANSNWLMRLKVPLAPRPLPPPPEPAKPWFRIPEVATAQVAAEQSLGTDRVLVLHLYELMRVSFPANTRRKARRLCERKREGHQRSLDGHFAATLSIVELALVESKRYSFYSWFCTAA